MIRCQRLAARSRARARCLSPAPTTSAKRDDVFGATNPYLPLKSRADVLVFQTEPLNEDVEVVGPIVARLFVSSTATDTDFTVKLVDVYPPSADFPSGYEMNLTDGILRARYRDRPTGKSYGTRQYLRDRGYSVPERQSLQERSSHSRRHIEQQLSRALMSIQTPASPSANIVV